MKLHENQEVVNELKRILKEDYPDLEYSDQMSKKLSEDRGKVRNDRLYVNVKPRMGHTARDRSMIEDVCEKLYQATNISFDFDMQSPGRFYSRGDERISQNLETEWGSFCLKRVM